MHKGLTLIELLIVVVVLGILATLALPNFFGTRERTYDQEVIANLILIWHAQEMYRMERGCYFPVDTGDPGGSDIDIINQHLRLNLNDRIWTYDVQSSGPDQYCSSGYGVFATRSVGIASGYARIFNITQAQKRIGCDGDGCPWATYDF